MPTPQTDFEWDPDKAARNVRKHGVRFETAATVFMDPLAMSVADDEHEFEERWVTQGLAENKEILVVAHTYDEKPKGRATVRIISARKATRKERKAYEEGS